MSRSKVFDSVNISQQTTQFCLCAYLPLNLEAYITNCSVSVGDNKGNLGKVVYSCDPNGRESPS